MNCENFCRRQNALYLDQTVEKGCRCVKEKNTFMGSSVKDDGGKAQ